MAVKVGPSETYSQLSVDRREIRLLSINPELEDDTISCNLRIVSLDDRPIYTALSYVWGDPADSKLIEVNGQTLPITVNLEAALRRLRKLPLIKELWIDAICINQKNVEERNTQIALIGSLYTNASEVIIWLGEGDVGSDMLADMLTAGLPIRPDRSSPNYMKEFDRYKIECRKCLSLIIGLGDRAWWSRVWCVQECVLPIKTPTFYCVERAFTWSQFFSVFDLFDEVSDYQAIPNGSSELDSYTDRELFRELEDLQQILNTSLESSAGNFLATLFQLEDARDDFRLSGTDKCINSPLKLCFDRLASIAHDYIYGFLSLFPVRYRRWITVDYQLSHSLIYQEVIIMLLSEGEEEDCTFLSSLSFPQPTNATEPQTQLSWVPDFSAQKHHDKNNSNGLACLHPWRLPRVCWSDNRSIFMPQGVYLDVIVDEVSFTKADTDGFQQELITLERDAKTVVNMSTDGKMGTIRDQISSLSLHRLFTCGSGSTVVSAFDNVSAFNNDSRDLAWEIMMGRNNITDLERDLDGRSIHAVTRQIEESANASTKGRKMIMTEHGFVGISIPNAQKGDAVTFLYGFPMAMILRPGPHYYTVVGGAYIHGLMDWPSLDDFHDQGLLPQAVFRIR